GSRAGPIRLARRSERTTRATRPRARRASRRRRARDLRESGRQPRARSGSSNARSTGVTKDSAPFAHASEGAFVSADALLRIDVLAEIRKLARAQLQGDWQLPSEFVRHAIASGARAIELRLDA